MTEDIKIMIDTLLEEANQQYEISKSYLKQDRIIEQKYHFGRYTGLRDAATKLELKFL